MPALPTSIGPLGHRRRRAGRVPRTRTSSARPAPGRRGAGRPAAWSSCRLRRGSRGSHGLGRHRAEDRRAVGDRLVRRRAQVAAQPVGGIDADERQAHGVPPPGAASCPARLRRGSDHREAQPGHERRRLVGAGVHPEGDLALAVVGRRAEGHVGDVDARAAERERDVGDDPGAVGHRHAQLAGGPRPQPGLDQRRARRVAAWSCQLVRSAPARSCARTVSSSAMAPSRASASASRLAA